MINTSATYRANINTETPQKWHVKGIITFANLQFYEFDDHDVWENPVKIQDSTSKPDTFEVGQAPIGQLTLTFQNFDGRFNKYDFAGAKIQLSIAEMTRTGNTGGSKPYSILPPNVVMNYEIYTGVFN